MGLHPPVKVIPGRIRRVRLRINHYHGDRSRRRGLGRRVSYG